MQDHLDRLAKMRRQAQRPPRRNKLLLVIAGLIAWGAAIAFLLHEMGS